MKILLQLSREEAHAFNGLLLRKKSSEIDYEEAAALAVWHEAYQSAMKGETDKSNINGDVSDLRLADHKWPGPGPEPASWYAADGTKVYRSYADYCND